MHRSSQVGWLYTVVWLASSWFAEAEIFTSIVLFERALHAEEALAAKLGDFIKHEEDRLQKLKRLAADYREHSDAALVNSERHLGDPLNAFRLIKKFTNDYYSAAELINNQHATDFAKDALYSVVGYPTDEDFVGCAQALMRIQDTYALDTTTVANGLVATSKTRPMTADDCYELGRAAYRGKDYYHAILWFKESLERHVMEEADNSTIAEMMGYYSFAVYKQGNMEAALNLTELWLQYDPDNSMAIGNVAFYEKEIAKKKIKRDPSDIHNPRQRQGYHATPEFDNYEKLCRGEATKPNPFRNQVYCRYKRTHWYNMLRPLKEEILYLSPFVALYHDLITESEIETVKKLAKPKLKRSAMISMTKKTDEYRISKSAWLDDKDDAHIRRVSQRVSFATGLTVHSSEDLQVLNYGLGGQYEPHMDWAKNMTVAAHRKSGHFARFGNRISTSLFYRDEARTAHTIVHRYSSIHRALYVGCNLKPYGRTFVHQGGQNIDWFIMSHVEAGGGTVFPNLGVQVQPEKGMMLFWYNLHRNGTGDKRTLHAGCPVLVGSKWVCNKWIHELHQEFRRPCLLNKGE